MSTNQNWTEDTEEKVEAEKSGATRMNSSQSAKQADPEKEKKKKKGVFITIAATAALLLLGVGGFGVYSMVKKGNAAATERDNTMSLIQRYLDRGEYDRALDLLEDLLIKNGNDPEALSLLEEILARMALEDLSDDKDIEEILRKLAESGALGGIEGLEGIQGLEDLRALIEAANRNNATMNEILRQQQAQGKSGSGGAGSGGNSIKNMSQGEVADRVDQMLRSGDYKGLENMDSDEFARLMKELAADGSLEGLSQEEIAKRIEKLIQEGGYEGLEGLDSAEHAKIAKNLSKFSQSKAEASSYPSAKFLSALLIAMEGIRKYAPSRAALTVPL